VAFLLPLFSSPEFPISDTIPCVKKLQVVVIGGGAAGFFGAITCAESYPDCRVLLLEKNRQLLGKVRISGGGRCNVTQACFDPAVLVQHYPRGGQALRGPFSRFQPRETMAWFSGRGVALKTEGDGRVFPITDDSATIVNCLLRAAQTAGVEIRTEVAVTTINPAETGFVIGLKGGEVITADRLLLATGSNQQGYRWAAELGHTIEPPVPSLFTFTLTDARLDGLAGVSVPNARLKLAGTKLEQSGPALITHWGLSGPAVLKLSAWGARFLHDQQYKAPLIVNWLPELSQDEVGQTLARLKSERARRQIADDNPGLPGLPQRLWQRLVGAAGIPDDLRWADLSKKQLHSLLGELHQGPYQIEGKGVFKEEFVTCGGVRLDGVNFKTMASRRCPGLYLAGEILDIDGLTGGYNFQSAWTTGWLAGKGMGM
jgi:predicted Rossmann fold flavoprotein